MSLKPMTVAGIRGMCTYTPPPHQALHSVKLVVETQQSPRMVIDTFRVSTPRNQKLKLLIPRITHPWHLSNASCYLKHVIHADCSISTIVHYTMVKSRGVSHTSRGMKTGQSCGLHIGRQAPVISVVDWHLQSWHCGHDLVTINLRLS